MSVRQFLLPDLGEGLEDAEIVSWRVAEGEHVELNQILVEVNTAKALVELPSPWTGVVERHHAAEGDVVRVGRPLFSIRIDRGGDEDDEGEAGGESEGAHPPERRAVLVGYGVEADEPQPRSRTPAASGDRADPVAASPPVRKLAKELGIDLATVAGTGPDGRITRDDVTAMAAAPSPSAFPVDDNVAEVIPVRGTRRLIAEHMARSAREIPHVTTFLTLDASSLQAFRQEVEERTGERVGPLPIVVRALANVCAEFSTLNASFNADRSEILVYGMCNVGVATDTDRGLMVPVVRDAGAKGIAEIARQISRLVEAARAGTIAPGDLTGGTITVTNVGTFGAEFGTPIINHPQACILALGVIEPRALVEGGDVVARPAAMLSLTFDHRLLDGAEAGRALKALVDILESPLKLASLPR